MTDTDDRIPDISEYYTVKHPEEFKTNWRAFYEKANALSQEARRDLPHKLNIPYGDHRKQKLDLFFPEGPLGGGRPVFLFLHGGAFREGDRAHYGYVAKSFGLHGIITAVAGYRLAPEFVYPSQPEDVQLALAWIYRNIASYGGDPNRIGIGGHSAGAILSAHATVRTDWQKRHGLPQQIVKGLAAVSSPYDLRKVKWTEEYLPDPKVREDASPIFNIRQVPPRAVIAVGTDEETEGWVNPTIAFAEALKRKNAEVDLVLLEGLDHPGTALAAADKAGKLFQSVLNIIRPERRE